MNLRSYFVWIGIALSAAACAPGDTESVRRIDPTPDDGSAPIIIYVTPTPRPTAIPTIGLVSPSPPATTTNAPPPTSDQSRVQAQCLLEMETLYTQATEACIGDPAGFFCNGGLPPRAQPGGPISNGMAVVGSLVEAEIVSSVHTAPLPSNHSGGVMWLRLEEPMEISALLVGDVHIQNVTPLDGNFKAWQSIQLETRMHESDCLTAPKSALILQGPYGGIGTIVVNGVSTEINGSLAVQTHGATTIFTALEGRARLIIFGEGRILYAGEQVIVSYPEGDFSRPLAVPDEALPLSYDNIRNFPIVLLDRPVLLPQPGVIFTEGRVNMRSAPDVDSRLLFQVPDDQPLSILGENTERTWYHVRLGNGETGWMRNDLVRFKSDTDISMMLAYDPTPVPPQRYGSAGNRAVVIAPNGGNLRRAPDVQFEVIDTVEPGTVVTLLARSPYSPWVKVDTGAQIGWMALITIETQAVVSFLPIDFDVPNPPGPTATPLFTFGGGHAYPDPRAGQ